MIFIQYSTIPYQTLFMKSIACQKWYIHCKLSLKISHNEVYMCIFFRYSFVFVFLGFSLLFLVLFRGIVGYLMRCYFRKKLVSKASIFYSLIWIPIVVVFHAIFAGLICE